MLFDTSVWIEYFSGTKLGEHVRKLLQSEKSLFTNPLSLAELTQWAAKYNKDKSKILPVLYKRSRLIELTDDILETAGSDYNKLRTIKEKISMVDIIIYASARVHNLTLFTKDRDFENLPSVELLK